MLYVLLSHNTRRCLSCAYRWLPWTGIALTLGYLYMTNDPSFFKNPNLGVHYQMEPLLAVNIVAEIFFTHTQKLWSLPLINMESCNSLRSYITRDPVMPMYLQSVMFLASQPSLEGSWPHRPALRYMSTFLWFTLSFPYNGSIYLFKLKVLSLKTICHVAMIRSCVESSPADSP